VIIWHISTRFGILLYQEKSGNPVHWVGLADRVQGAAPIVEINITTIVEFCWKRGTGCGVGNWHFHADRIR
jgi:hypothetical protein